MATWCIGWVNGVKFRSNIAVTINITSTNITTEDNNLFSTLSLPLSDDADGRGNNTIV